MRLIRTLVLGAAGVAAYKYWKKRQADAETVAPASYPPATLDLPEEDVTPSPSIDSKQSGSSYGAP